MATYQIVFDCGNSATKAVLVGNGRVIESVIVPSLLRFTDDNHFIRGGATLIIDGNKQNFVVGWDNEERRDAIIIANDSRGKLKYLPNLLAGAVSSLFHHLKSGDTLACYILTLNVSERKTIVDAVDTLATIEVDGIPLKLKPKLFNIYSEGFGCSAFASSIFPDRQQFKVFDLGGGTANLSSYFVGNDSFPRRQAFKFEPTGIGSLLDLIKDELRQSSTNGRVNNQLIKFAIESNTLRLLDSFEGTCIRKSVEVAVSAWLNSPEMQSLMNQVLFTLQQGTPVVACGGGWKINIVRETIEAIVASNANPDLFHIPEDSHLLGASGLANIIANEKTKTVKKEISNDQSKK
jgi:hypothetical protein